MKPKDKATELTEKFGSNALSILNETFEVWNIKRHLAELNALEYQSDLRS